MGLIYSTSYAGATGGNKLPGGLINHKWQNLPHRAGAREKNIRKIGISGLMVFGGKGA